MRQGALTKFHQKKALWISPKHPLYFETTKFKIYYCACILLHARLNSNSNPLGNFEFERLLTKGFSLGAKETLKIMELSKTVQSTIDKLIESLPTPFYRCLFLMDLINVSISGSSSISKDEDKSILLFAKLLEIDNTTKDLLFQFTASAQYESYEDCFQLLKTINYLHLGLSLSDLSYYMLNYPYTTQLSQHSLIQGDSHSFHSKCEIREPLLIPKETTLEISNAILHIYCPITVSGGTLSIKDSHVIFHDYFQDKMASSPFTCAFIQAEYQGHIHFSYSNFNCQNNGSLIAQRGGILSISSCNIENTRGNSAIFFNGSNIHLENDQFKNCITTSNGGAIEIEHGSGLIKNCIFTECEAKSGGGIFSTDQTKIINCHFQSCRSISYGSAIYYQGKINSNVTDCQCSLCFPPEDEIVQYIGRQANLNSETSIEFIIDTEEQFSYSAILDCSLTITESGTLTFNNINLYISAPILCLGILHMKHTKVFAENPVERDLFIFDTIRRCNISYCQFDGKLQCGIFHVKNGRLDISHCVFNNTANGRAIYNAFAPDIRHCIFSLCENGAIYCKSGKITNCLFLNCRGKSGPGIQMYGNRGEIEACRFIRCISETTKDAIDISGSYHIRNCTYEECNIQ